MGLNLGVIFMNIPPGLDELMVLYGVSYTQISILITALVWSHALMQVPAGLMTDRLGIKFTLYACLILIICGHILPLASPDLTLAVVGRIIAGIGTGLSVASTMKLVALYAPKGRIGTYQAFFGGFFSIGSILAYLFLPYLISFRWQWVYIAPLITCLPLLIMLGRLRLPPDRSDIAVSLHVGKVFRMREAWILGIYHALSFGSILTLGNWVPSLLSEVSHHTSAVHFAWGGALIMLISGIGRISGGFVLLRTAPLSIVNSSLVLLSVMYVGIFVVKSTALVLVLALMAAWFASVNFGAIFHIASEVSSPDYYATLFGFINFLANLGAVLFTIMFGIIKDSVGSFLWGFPVMALIVLTAYLTGRASLRKGLVHEHRPS